MTPALLGALALFAFVSSITPGPNNAMLLASGANFGLRATLPHMAGVLIGFLALIVLTGFGLAGVFAAYPVLHDVLKWAGGAYLLYLAARIALSDSLSNKAAGARPMSFVEAVLFQAVNPKGWAMALGAVTAYAPAEGYFGNVLLVALVFAPINGSSIAAWTTFGVGMRRFLDSPRALRAFNLAMGLLLALSLWPLGVELVGSLAA